MKRHIEAIGPHGLPNGRTLCGTRMIGYGRWQPSDRCKRCETIDLLHIRNGGQTRWIPVPNSC